MAEKQSNMKSADDLIVKIEAEKLGTAIPTANDKAEAPQEVETQDNAETQSSDQTEKPDTVEELQASEEEQPETHTENKPEKTQALDDSSDNPDEVDEYGTKIGKPKLYTEEEVQNMIRDRLKRGRQSDAVNEAVKDFKPDENSEESWEVQLETFIEKTVDKISKRTSEREWREREEATQAEFETKFTQGMTKYNDFRAVVADKPISNAMMLAVRTMKDPAAFIYAACKQHPQEVERIASIKDAVVQATEIGRLEERMKKARTVTTAPKPSVKIKGDASDNVSPQLGIDAKIAHHAKVKFGNKR